MKCRDSKLFTFPWDPGTRWPWSLQNPGHWEWVPSLIFYQSYSSLISQCLRTSSRFRGVSACRVLSWVGVELSMKTALDPSSGHVRRGRRSNLLQWGLRSILSGGMLVNPTDWLGPLNYWVTCATCYSLIGSITHWCSKLLTFWLTLLLTIFWVTGRLGPFDPPFSTYVEFWPLLLGSDVEYWPPFFKHCRILTPIFTACRILTPIFRLLEFWPLYFLELWIFEPFFAHFSYWCRILTSATDVEFWGHRVRPSLPARDELEYPPPGSFAHSQILIGSPTGFTHQFTVWVIRPLARLLTYSVDEVLGQSWIHPSII